MEEWGASAAVIDETVRVTKEFLEKNLDEAKKVGDITHTNVRYMEPGSHEPACVGKRIISRFLGKGWPEPKVMRSLQRLSFIEEGVDKESMEKMNSLESSLNFLRPFMVITG